MEKLDKIEGKIDKITEILGTLDDKYDKRYASKTVETGLVWALKIVGSAVIIALLALIGL